MDYAMVIRVKKPSFYTRKCFEARKIVELSDPKAVNHVEDERLFLVNVCFNDQVDGHLLIRFAQFIHDYSSYMKEHDSAR
ncbi:uncharacterized protein LOC113561714 isoform X2 [Ooceraea biroi]|uniref:uncharacterized protein LOC113561714 isoform X2 n=1 Tax=Ooceraea biroi TaxID=2015173 RepID=UPI000F096443|nr:uncharacterized protein LOC113561714 isoform X2 [Ooceraea biroi]